MLKEDAFNSRYAVFGENQRPDTPPPQWLRPPPSLPAGGATPPGAQRASEASLREAEGREAALRAALADREAGPSSTNDFPPTHPRHRPHQRGEEGRRPPGGDGRRRHRRAAGRGRCGANASVPPLSASPPPFHCLDLEKDTLLRRFLGPQGKSQIQNPVFFLI